MSNYRFNFEKMLNGIVTYRRDKVLDIIKAFWKLDKHIFTFPDDVEQLDMTIGKTKIWIPKSWCDITDEPVAPVKNCSNCGNIKMQDIGCCHDVNDNSAVCTDWQPKEIPLFDGTLKELDGLTSKSVYLAGKITGDSTYKKKFEEASYNLHKMGYTIMNPATLPKGFEWNEYMTVTLSMLDVCDIACFLPDWTDSKGAMLEYGYAVAKGKEVLFYDELKGE